MSDAEAQGGEGTATRMDIERERAVTALFVSIANALVEGHDILDLYLCLTADCARILDIASAGLLLADARGNLQVVAASSEATRDLELFVLQGTEGPCLDCHRTGVPVLVPDLAAEANRWPRFAPVAGAAGFACVHALPMRLGDTTLGTLALFGTSPGILNSEDLAMAQAFAHVASIALIAGRAAADKTLLTTQLQTALDSRVALEQAKGILTECGGLSMEQAFNVMRRYSRDRNLRLSDLAAAMVTRALPAGVVLAHARVKGVLPPFGG